MVHSKLYRATACLLAFTLTFSDATYTAFAFDSTDNVEVVSSEDDVTNESELVVQNESLESDTESINVESDSTTNDGDEAEKPTSSDSSEQETNIKSDESSSTNGESSDQSSDTTDDKLDDPEYNLSFDAEDEEEDLLAEESADKSSDSSESSIDGFNADEATLSKSVTGDALGTTDNGNGVSENGLPYQDLSDVNLIVKKKYSIKIKKMKGKEKKKIVWASSDENVATVKKGKIKAVDRGVAIITGTYTDKIFRVKVTVDKPTLTAKKTSMNIGESKYMTLKGILSQPVEWSVKQSKKKPAIEMQSISGNALIKTLQKGSATIWTKIGKKKYSFKVKVGKNQGTTPTDPYKKEILYEATQTVSGEAIYRRESDGSEFSLKYAYGTEPSETFNPDDSGGGEDDGEVDKPGQTSLGMIVAEDVEKTETGSLLFLDPVQCGVAEVTIRYGLSPDSLTKDKITDPELGLVEPGEKVVYYSVTKDGYKPASGSYKLTVKKSDKPLDVLPPVLATNIQVAYDGNAKFLDPIECDVDGGFEASYGLVEGTYDHTSIIDEELGQTELGKKIVYYKAHKDGYYDVVGSYYIEVVESTEDEKLPLGKITAPNKTEHKSQDTRTVYLDRVTCETEEVTIKYGLSEDNYEFFGPDEDPSLGLSEAGTLKVFFEVSKDGYKTEKGFYVLTLIDGRTPPAYDYVKAENKTIPYDGEMHYLAAVQVSPEATVMYGAEEGDYKYSTTEIDDLGQKEPGTRDVYYYVTEPEHKDVYGTYSLTITDNGDGNVFEYTAKNRSYPNTGAYQYLTPVVVTNTDDAKISYGLDGSSFPYSSITTEELGLNTEGTKRVFFKIEKEGWTTALDSYNLKVYPGETPALLKLGKITAKNKTEEITKGELSLDPVTCETDGVTVMYGRSATALTSSRITDFTLREPGTLTVFYKVSKEGYESVPGSYTLTALAKPEDYEYNIENVKATNKIIPFAKNTVCAPDAVTYSPADAIVKYGLDEGEYKYDITSDDLKLSAVGKKTIYYRITKENYKPATGSFTIEVVPGASDILSAPGAVMASSKTVVVDDTPKFPDPVRVTDFSTGANITNECTVRYGTVQGEYPYTASTKIKLNAGEVGSVTIYYKVSKEGCSDVVGSYTLTVLPSKTYFEFGNVTAKNKVVHIDKDYTDTIYYLDPVTCSNTAARVVYSDKSFKDKDNENIYESPNANEALGIVVHNQPFEYISSEHKTVYYKVYNSNNETEAIYGSYELAAVRYSEYATDTIDGVNAISKIVTYDGSTKYLDPVTATTSGVSVRYGLSSSSYPYSDIESEALGLTLYGTKTVYYNISKDGCKDVSGSYSLTVIPKVDKTKDVFYEVNASSKSFEYDDEMHYLSPVVVIETAESSSANFNGTIKYGTDGTDFPYTSITNQALGLKNTGAKTVYYKVEKDGYLPTIGSYSITVTESNATKTLGTVKAYSKTVTFDGTKKSLDDVECDTAAAVINYGVEEGTYTISNITDNRLSLTDVGTKVVYYQVVADGYRTVTGSVILEVIPESNGGSNFTSVSAKNSTVVYDEKTHFLDPVEVLPANTATVKYGTKAGEYSYTDITNSALGLKDPGKKTVYYKVEATDYITITGKYDLTVLNQDPNADKPLGTITAENVTALYTGEPIYLSPVTCETAGATIRYGTSVGNYNYSNIRDNALSLTNTGKKIVYYQVSKEGYTTVDGSYTLIVNKEGVTPLGTIKATSKQLKYNGNMQYLDPITCETAGVTIKYGLNLSDFDYTDITSEALGLKDEGRKVVFYQVSKDDYTTVTGSYVLAVDGSADSELDVFDTIIANSITYVYDEAPHSLDPITCATAGATIEYGTTQGSYTTSDVSTFTITDPGVLTVFFQITKEGYKKVEGYYTLTISNAPDPSKEDLGAIYSRNKIDSYDGTLHFLDPVTCETEGTEIRYGTTAGEYNYTDITSPDLGIKDVGYKVVYYQVSKEGYSTRTGNFYIQIEKGFGKLTLSKSVETVTFPSTTTFEILDNPSGGALSVITSDTSIAKATLNGTTVTVTTGSKAGTAEITVKVAPNGSFSGGYAVFSLIVNSGQLVPISAVDKTFKYDGQMHYLTEPSSAVDGVRYTYGLIKGNYAYGRILNTDLGLKDIGSKTVYFKAEKPGYASVEGSYTLRIIEKDPPGNVTATSKSYVYNGEMQYLPAVTCDASDATIKYGTTAGTYNIDSITDSSLGLKMPGKKTVHYEVSRGKSYGVIQGSIELTIVQAPGKVTLANNMGSVRAPINYSVAVTENLSGGRLSVQSSDLTIASASVVNNMVTITPGSKAGLAFITVKSAANGGYAEATTKFIAYVTLSEMGAPTVTTAKFIYDGQPHYCDNVTLEEGGNGLSIMYSETNDESGYIYSYTSQSTKLGQIDAGEKMLYYRITKPGYKPKYGTVKVIVDKAEGELQFFDTVADVRYPETVTFKAKESNTWTKITSVKSSYQPYADPSIISTREVKVQSGPVVYNQTSTYGSRPDDDDQNAEYYTITATTDGTKNYKPATASFKVKVMKGTLKTNPIKFTEVNKTYDGQIGYVSVSGADDKTMFFYSEKGTNLDSLVPNNFTPKDTSGTWMYLYEINDKNPGKWTPEYRSRLNAGVTTIKYDAWIPGYRKVSGTYKMTVNKATDSWATMPGTITTTYNGSFQNIFSEGKTKTGSTINYWTGTSATTNNGSPGRAAKDAGTYCLWASSNGTGNYTGMDPHYITYSWIDKAHAKLASPYSNGHVFNVCNANGTVLSSAFSSSTGSNICIGYWNNRKDTYAGYTQDDMGGGIISITGDNTVLVDGKTQYKSGSKITIKRNGKAFNSGEYYFLIWATGDKNHSDTTYEFKLTSEHSYTTDYDLTEHCSSDYIDITYKKTRTCSGCGKAGSSSGYRYYYSIGDYDGEIDFSPYDMGSDEYYDIIESGGRLPIMILPSYTRDYVTPTAI